MDQQDMEEQQEQASTSVVGYAMGLACLCACVGGLFAVFIRASVALPAGVVIPLAILAAAIAGAVLGKWIGDIVRRQADRSKDFPQLPAHQLLVQLMDAAPFFVFLKDLDGRILLANDHFRKTYGLDPAEFLGSTDHELFPAHIADTYRANDVRVAETGQVLLVEEPSQQGEDTRIHTCTKFPVFGADGLVVAIGGIAIDETEKRSAEAALESMEAQLSHAQRMESIGRLAGGVAHDYNNLLTAIIGYADMALNQLEERHGAREVLLKLKSVSNQSSQLTQQLLAFARKDVISPVRLDIHKELSRAAELIDRLVGDDVEVSYDFGAKDVTVLMDQGQLTQLVMNLVTNARDVMTSGGTLHISTRNSGSRDQVGAPQGWLEILFKDAGPGIPADLVDRVFEPFFTSKEAGMGTGLGLSTCYGILRQSGGDIVVEETSPSGTTFVVRLPVSDDKPESHVGLQAIDERVFMGKKVLLVEDDEAVREVAENILQRIGCDVLSAANGHDASRLIDTNDDIFLLLTDVVMPAMSGIEVAEIFREKHPYRPILFVSGYAESQAIEPWLLKPGVRFAAKPYRKEDLLMSMYKASRGARRASSGRTASSDSWPI